MRMRCPDAWWQAPICEHCGGAYHGDGKAIRRITRRITSWRAWSLQAIGCSSWLGPVGRLTSGCVWMVGPGQACAAPLVVTSFVVMSRRCLWGSSLRCMPMCPSHLRGLAAAWPAIPLHGGMASRWQPTGQAPVAQHATHCVGPSAWAVNGCVSASGTSLASPRFCPPLAAHGKCQ